MRTLEQARQRGRGDRLLVGESGEIDEGAIREPPVHRSGVDCAGLFEPGRRDGLGTCSTIESRALVDCPACVVRGERGATGREVGASHQLRVGNEATVDAKW